MPAFHGDARRSPPGGAAASGAKVFGGALELSGRREYAGGSHLVRRTLIFAASYAATCLRWRQEVRDPPAQASKSNAVAVLLASGTGPAEPAFIDPLS